MSKIKKRVKVRAYRRAVEDMLRKKRRGEDPFAD